MPKRGASVDFLDLQLSIAVKVCSIAYMTTPKKGRFVGAELETRIGMIQPDESSPAMVPAVVVRVRGNSRVNENDFFMATRVELGHIPLPGDGDRAQIGVRAIIGDDDLPQGEVDLLNLSFKVPGPAAKDFLSQVWTHHGFTFIFSNESFEGRAMIGAGGQITHHEVTMRSLN